MIPKLILLIVISISCAILVAREILRVGEGRRNGDPAIKLYKRFRRRTKGLMLIPPLYAWAVWQGEMSAAFAWTPQMKILGFGVGIIGVIWLMILAARDMREAADDAVELSRSIRQDAIAEIEEVLEKRKAAKQADREEP